MRLNHPGASEDRMESTAPTWRREKDESPAEIAERNTFAA